MVIENYKSVGICALLHFLVDGLCACCLYLVVWPSTTLDVVSLFIIYNVLAFLTQPLTGWVVDHMHQKHWMLLGSMLLMTLAVALSIFTTYHFLLTTHHLLLTIIPVLLGIANSMFHVWGGQLTAVRTQNDIRSLGMFVSTGAFGLAVGLADYISSGLIKPLVCRLRPTHEPAIMDTLHLVNNYRGGWFGFVSSHAANTLACALLFCLVWRKPAAYWLMLWVALNCYSRMYLGVHYLGDILGGLAVGCLTAGLAYLLWKYVERRWLPSPDEQGGRVIPQADADGADRDSTGGC